MKKTVRFISALLTVLMLMSSVVIVGAAEPAEGVEDYLTYVFSSEQAKLNSMKLEREQNGYRIYCDEYTGEVAFQKVATGQTLFSNPYDVGSLPIADATKEQLLSQIIIYYQTAEGEEKDPMTSYHDAVVQGGGAQVQVEPIRNGIRVEYTIGRQETRRLIPRMIEKSRFETLILENITNDFERDKAKNMYVYMDPYDETLPEKTVAEMKAKYPITNSMAVYICSTDISFAEEDRLESIIKKYCPEYTYETLDEDHQITEYQGSADVAPPLFRLALEYTIDASGLNVRLPANGIRFDDTAYTLTNVDILPFMGAISSEYDGYSFIPDGSGAIVEAKKLAGESWGRECDLYGYDYAYHQLMEAVTNPQEETRFPVWGAVTDRGTTTVQKVIKPATTEVDPETGEETLIPAETESIEVEDRKGYVAIITEGESLATIRHVNGGAAHKYSYTYARVQPRPFDTYNLSESIEAASNAEWTVVSPRKYVDSYRIKFILLDGDDQAELAGINDYYETSYFGMAEAYRDYLEETGILTRLTKEDVKDKIPLYIELLGTLKTTEKIFSIPVTVDTPLTTFENIKTMYDELAAKGVDNVNFKLLGFANGGLSNAGVPYNLKWEKAVGGNNGFREIMEYAKEKGFELFPDFDFVYAPNDKTFDGFSYRKHAVKTINDQYTSKRYYDATTQSFTRNFEIAISASTFDYFYTHFAKEYEKYEPTGISLSTLGMDLNSDFDEDEPYNREDIKQFTTDLLEKIAGSYDVMVDEGNAYTYKYVDHIVNMKFESSHFFNASYSVPFNGIVLHGFVNTASTPLNEEGDIESALLRAIESGSYLNFVFAYENVEKLKQDDELSKYYSVRYNIWFDDVVEYYNKINEAIGDLQTALITGHEFITGQRVPDADELEADKKAQEEYKAALEAAKKEEEEREFHKLELEKNRAERDTGAMIEEITAILESMTASRDAFNEAVAALAALKDSVAAEKDARDAAKAAADAAQKAVDDAQAALDASEAEDKTELEADVAAKKEALTAAQNALTEAQAALDAKAGEVEYEKSYKAAENAAKKVISEAEGVATIVENAQHKVEITKEHKSAAAVAANAAKIESVADEIETLKTSVENGMKTVEDLYSLEDKKEEAPEPDAPETDEPAADEPTTDEPATDEPATDEPTTDEPTTDEPTTDEPAADEPTTDEPADEEPDELDTTSKYIVDDGSIVLVTYETGKAFILNYNEFTVSVTVDGKTYTVDAYDFVTLNR